MNRENGLRPSGNSPNPAKFLKEMESLVPKLKAKGIIPLNREEARALGEKGTKAAALKAEAEHRRRMDIIARRLDEYIAELAPLTFWLVRKTGWAWLIRFMGYRYDIEATNETVQGCPDIPCTRIFVRRSWFPRWSKGKVAKAERLVWEEPKPPKKPKSRIILP